MTREDRKQFNAFVKALRADKRFVERKSWSDIDNLQEEKKSNFSVYKDAIYAVFYEHGKALSFAIMGDYSWQFTSLYYTFTDINNGDEVQTSSLSVFNEEIKKTGVSFKLSALA